MRNRTPEHTAWMDMNHRVRCHGSKDYRHYGGRGITIAPAWGVFATFLADMGPRPPNATLERIDNDGNYSKDNCQWVTRARQQYNTRQTKLKPSDIASIKVLRAAGSTPSALGKAFHIDPSTISRICAGKRWREVECAVIRASRAELIEAVEKAFAFIRGNIDPSKRAKLLAIAKDVLLTAVAKARDLELDTP